MEPAEQTRRGSVLPRPSQMPAPGMHRMQSMEGARPERRGSSVRPDRRGSGVPMPEQLGGGWSSVPAQMI
eukprot:2302197-Prymnesium_polylepis.1